MIWLSLCLSFSLSVCLSLSLFLSLSLSLSSFIHALQLFNYFFLLQTAATSPSPSSSRCPTTTRTPKFPGPSTRPAPKPTWPCTWSRPTGNHQLWHPDWGFIFDRKLSNANLVYESCRSHF